jgi:hypothetical protein
LISSRCIHAGSCRSLTPTSIKKNAFLKLILLEASHY